MKMDIKKVEKLLDTFFTLSNVHPQPIIRIIKEIRSIYDGEYPYFELVYDAEKYNGEYEMEKLINSITGYTGLKEGRDYWLNVTWEYTEE